MRSRHPELPPPRTVGVLGWVKYNLLSTPFNVVMPLLAICFLWLLPLFEWIVLDSIWIGRVTQGILEQDGSARRALLGFIKGRLGLFVSCLSGYHHTHYM